MTFHVRGALSNIQTNDPGKSFVAIGDTVVVREEGAEIITKDIRKKYNDISYLLENSAEVKADTAAAK